MNESFKKDSNNVLLFLDKVDNDMSLIIDKLNFVGEMNMEDMFDFVKIMYTNNKKVKEIK